MGNPKSTTPIFESCVFLEEQTPGSDLGSRSCTFSNLLLFWRFFDRISPWEFNEKTSPNRVSLTQRNLHFLRFIEKGGVFESFWRAEPGGCGQKVVFYGAQIRPSSEIVQISIKNRSILGYLYGANWVYTRFDRDLY